MSDPDQTTPAERIWRNAELVRQKLTEMWNAEPSMSHYAIAKALHIDHKAVARIADQNGLPARNAHDVKRREQRAAMPTDRRKHHDATVRALLAELWVAEPPLTESAIAKRLGITGHAVRGLASRCGLRTRGAAPVTPQPRRGRVDSGPDAGDADEEVPRGAQQRHVPSLLEVLAQSSTLAALMADDAPSP